MSKNLFFLLSLCFGFVLFILALSKIGLKNIFSAVSVFSFSKLFVVLFINFLIVLVSSWRWKIIIQSRYPLPISFFKVLRAKMIGLTINYLTPVVFIGGEPVRAYSLKQEAKVPLDKGAASIVIDGAIYLSVVFLFFLIGLAYLFSYFVPPKGFLFVTAGVVIFSITVLYIFYYKTFNGDSEEKGFFNFFISILGLNKIKAIRKIEQGINNVEQDISYFFKKQKIKLIIAFSLSAAEVLLVLLTYWLVIYFLGYNSGIKQILSVNALITLIFLVPIPAALGSFEISQAFVFPFLGISPAIGISFSLIIRIINLIMICFGMLVFTHFQLSTLIKKAERIEAEIVNRYKKFFYE